MAGAARGTYTAIARAAQGLGQAVLAFMAVTIGLDALLRYFFAAPTSWSLEVNTFLIVYLAIMTAADVQRSDAHIRITFFMDIAGPRGQRVGRAFVGLVGVAFCAVMAWRGWLITAQAWEYGERVSSSFGTPMVYPYALLPLGFALLAIQFLIDVIDAVCGRDLPPPEELGNV